MMFFAFACRSYYPAGGAHDCLGVFESLERAQAAVEARMEDEDYRVGHVAVVEGEKLKIGWQRCDGWYFYSADPEVKWREVSGS